MTGVVNSTTGMEHIAREAGIILLQQMNDAIVRQQDAWHPLDEEWAGLRGVDYEPIGLEEIPLPNFHIGIRPSLIEAKMNAYPNVTVMSDLAAPNEADEVDQMNKYVISLFVGIFVKGENEVEVNARIQRTVEAANICVLSNPTLRGYVNEMDGTPTIQITEPNARQEKTSHGKKWFLQGARIEYLIAKEAITPTGESRYEAEPPAPQYAGINIDQA